VSAVFDRFKESSIEGSAFPDTEFQLPRVLARGLSAWSCNVLPFTAIAALLYSPILVYAFWALQGPLDVARLENVDHWLLLGPAFLEPILAGLIAKAVLRQHRGKPTGVMEAIGEAARELVPLLGVTIVSALLVGIGCVAMVLPGLILYFVYWVAGPVAAIERPGIMAALRRSLALTRGHRLKLFGLVLLVGIVAFTANKMLLSSVKTATDVGEVKAHIAVYYLILINMVTIRAVFRAASYVELAGDAEPRAGE